MGLSGILHTWILFRRTRSSPLGCAPKACSTTLIVFCATCLLLECALLLRLGFQIQGNFVSGEKGVPLWPRTLKTRGMMILIGKLCCAFEGERREKSRENEPGAFLGN
jgi:hypothetical protein